MVNVGGSSEGGYLLMVTHDEEVGWGRIGGGGVGVLALDKRGDGGGCGAHGRRVGVDDVGEESLTAFPLHKVVQLATERAVGNDEVADGG